MSTTATLLNSSTSLARPLPQPARLSDFNIYERNMGAIARHTWNSAWSERSWQQLYTEPEDKDNSKAPSAAMGKKPAEEKPTAQENNDNGKDDREPSAPTKQEAEDAQKQQPRPRGGRETSAPGCRGACRRRKKRRAAAIRRRGRRRRPRRQR